MLLGVALQLNTFVLKIRPRTSGASLQGKHQQGRLAMLTVYRDTLFISGCGRFFEGKPEEMHKALNTTLASLPDDTLVGFYGLFCAG
jgi:hypothetical protein